MKLLVCRLKAFRCEKIQQNPWIHDYFGNIVTIDHYPLATYRDKGFEASYHWPPVQDVGRCQRFADECLQKHGITHAIISQKLYDYSSIMEEACIRNNVKFVWAEAFFDDKLIYDYAGLQYCRENDIKNHVFRIPVTPLDLPRSTRETQPTPLPKEMVYQKYRLTRGLKYIVIMGQLPWDMSLKQSINPAYSNYIKFISDVIDANREVQFLCKPHPKDVIPKRFGPRVTYVNESLGTLFEAFDNFLAFSSTTIFEGIIHNKKFATMGYHLCNDDRLVYQIKTNSHMRNLYNNLRKLSIDEEIKNRFLSFICNHYTIDFNSPRLLDKLVMTPEEFYVG